MTTQLILKRPEISIPIILYENETMYIDKSFKHILWNNRDKVWILWAQTKHNRCKTETLLNDGYLKMENAKLDNNIYPNYFKAKFK